MWHTIGCHMQTPEPSFFKATYGSLKNALIGCSMAAIFGIVVLVMSILSANHPLAAEEELMVVMPSPTVAQVQYYLPYPGILPDSALYKFKAMRDRVSLVFTSNRESKARKELLFADKRLGAAIALVEGGKSSLGTSTATKAEKYLEQSVNDTLPLKAEGKDVKSLLLTLINATSKHLEVLDALKNKVSGDDVASLEKVRMSTLLLQEKVTQALAGS